MGLDLKGTVSLDGSGFEAGLHRLEGAAHSFGHTLKDLAVEAFGVYTIAASVHKTIEMADSLLDMSRRLGIGAEALQEFGFAARQNGADLEKFASFVEHLNRARIDPEKMDAFRNLGISGSDLRNAHVEELILKLSANVSRRSSQEVVGPLRDIGGRGAGEMIVMLKDNLRELMEEARRLGQVISTEDAVMLKYLADEMKVVSQAILVGLAPALTFAMDKFLQLTNVVKALGTFLGSLTSTINPRQILGAILGVAPMNFVRAMMEQFQDSVLRAGFNFSENEAARQGMKDRLLKIQKDMEEINGRPDFSRVIKGQYKWPVEKERDYTDSLLRVGNFLGAAGSSMENIAAEHVQLTRQVVRHTQRSADALEELRHMGFSTAPAPSGDIDFPR